MATNDDGPGKGPAKGPAGAPEQPGAKKPAAIIDLKPTSVGVEDPKKAATPGGAGSPAGSKPVDTKPQDVKPTDVKPPEGKPQDGKPATPPPSSTVGGSGVPPVSTVSPSATARAGATDQGRDTPGGKPADKPAIKPTVATGGAAPAPTPASGTGSATAKPALPAARGGRLMSGLSHIAAGLAGGLLVLLGADALSTMGFDLRRSNTAHVRDLEARLSLMETASRSPGVPSDVAQRLAVAEQRVAAIDQLRQRLGDIDQRHSALVEGTKVLEQRLAGGTDDATTARVAKLENTLATLSRAAGEGQAGRLPQLAAITGRLTDLESTLSNQLQQLRKAVMTDVEGRISTTNEASEAARSGTQRIDRELAAQKLDVARLGQRVDGFRTQVDRVELQVKTAEEASATLKGAIDQIRNELKGVARPKDLAAVVEPVTGRLARLEQTLTAVERGEEERRNSVERIVLALELGNLKRAVERGTPFATELGQVRKLAGSRFDLAALERFKDQGVPTAAALHREFRDLMHRVLDADRAADNAGIVDRLLAGAKSIVRVRRTDTAADDTSAEAMVARMEAALKEGRLADVAQSAAKLSENARKVAAPWLDRVEASAAVERAITGVEGELKNTLGAAAKRG